MKRLIKIIIFIVLAVIIVIAVALYPKFNNMKSEYATSQAIRSIEAHIRENQGQWPRSPEELGDLYPPGGEVLIDYSATSSELIADPDKLRDAVRPRSGKFYTYPDYDKLIKRLLLALQETNNSKQEKAEPEKKMDIQ